MLDLLQQQKAPLHHLGVDQNHPVNPAASALNCIIEHKRITTRWDDSTVTCALIATCIHPCHAAAVSPAAVTPARALQDCYCITGSKHVILLRVPILPKQAIINHL